jgi:hypothetical protein
MPSVILVFAAMADDDTSINPSDRTIPRKNQLNPFMMFSPSEI